MTARTQDRKAMKEELSICESIHGTWHYHLREGASTRALCGAMVMHCGLSIDRWNKRILNHHIPESFCRMCEKLRNEGVQ